MSKLIVLGSAGAVPDDEHETTHLALAGRSGVILIDCAPHLPRRLRRAGLDFEQVTDLILTHFHPDHAAALPMFLMEIWLRGRRRPLTVHGLPDCLERALAVMQAFRWESWQNLYPVSWHSLETTEGAPVITNADFRISAVPVRHMIPALGLRVELAAAGRALVYSGDTEPCPALINLARGAEVLLHEATGAYPGHTSPAQAGEIARAAAVKRLVLIHYNPAETGQAAAAAAEFGGPVTLAEDFMELEW